MLGNEMFKFQEGVVSRWASHENPDGAKGAGGTARNGRKGAPWFTLNTGESRVLAHAENTRQTVARCAACSTREESPGSRGRDAG